MKVKILQLLAVAISCATAPAYSTVVLPDLDPVAVDTTGAAGDINNHAIIKFINELSSDVDLYWIDYEGNRVFYRTIYANSEYTQHTFLTHPWLIVLTGTGGTATQGSGTLWTAFMAQSPDIDLAFIRDVPEPGTLALLGLGLAGLGLSRRRKPH